MSIPKNLDKISLNDLQTQEFRSIVEQSLDRRIDFDLESRLAAAAPPSNNMGAYSPFTPLNISHSEISGCFDVQKTSIDWLGYSTFADPDAVLLGLQVVWPEMIKTSSHAGMRGYPKCDAFQLHGVQFGLVGYGAKHGRCSVSLTGVACKTLTHSLVLLLHDMLVVIEARLSRVDLCFDFYKGECTWDYAFSCFNRGEFAQPGRDNPKSSEIKGKGSKGENLGRTLYIGQRDSEKYGRVYEKGLEEFANLSDEYRESCTEREADFLTPLDGFVPTIADTWLRLEVEFKRKHKDRPIPLEMLLQRDAYFSGAYPFYARMLGCGDGKGRGYIPTDKEFCHDKLIMAHRASFGNHVHTLRKIGFTSTEIVNMLDTGVHNQKLLKAGLVTIETEAIRKFRVQDSTDSDIPF